MAAAGDEVLMTGVIVLSGVMSPLSSLSLRCTFGAGKEGSPYKTSPDPSQFDWQLWDYLLLIYQVQQLGILKPASLN